MMDGDLLARIEEAARAMLENCPACHDWDHTLRVYCNAMTIARQEKADEDIVAAAALLHDIGRPAELADQGKTDHATLGAILAAEVLRNLGVTDEAFIAAVADCVRSHRYRARQADAVPVSPEAKVIFDADKLDGIGAIGLARSFHFAGRTGARVHNSEAEALASTSYSREDTAYREYLVKLRHVKDRMLTETGRRLALLRHDFMVAFFQELDRELSDNRN